MLKDFRIQNFRGLEDVTLKNLGRINLIGGKNGSGKTSALEALWMFAAPSRPDIGYRVTSFRGVTIGTGNTIFRDIFNEMSIEKTISLTGRDHSSTTSHNLEVTLRKPHNLLQPFGDGATQSVTSRNDAPQALSSNEIVFRYTDRNGEKHQSSGLWAQESQVSLDTQTMEVNRGIHVMPADGVGIVPATFAAPKLRHTHGKLASNFGAFQIERQEISVLDFLDSIGPKVSALVPITLGDEVMLHAEVSNQKGLYPVNLLGEGALRALEIALSIAQIEEGVMLIDEVENGLHYTALSGFFDQLHQLSTRYDVQVFATTHSLECVKAAHLGLGPAGEKFTYHRIGQRQGKARAVYYDDEMLRTAFDLGLEIR